MARLTVKAVNERVAALEADVETLKGNVTRIFNRLDNVEISVAEIRGKINPTLVKNGKRSKYMVYSTFITSIASIVIVLIQVLLS